MARTFQLKIALGLQAAGHFGRKGGLGRFSPLLE
jgi:hypothetical protein